MPIIAPSPESGDSLHWRLQEAGATVITQEQAEHQDIRPARIGLLNLMPAPAMEQTETQWLRFMSHSVLQIQPILIKFDDDPREHDLSSRSPVLKRYTPFEDAIDEGIDGLIVTGDNLELKESGQQGLLPFDQINYHRQLADVVSWANHNVPTTIYSCLASHFALNYLFGLERERPTSKTFGVFDHEVDHTIHSDITEGLDDSFRAPHSRWGNIPPEEIAQTSARLLAVSEQIGWLLVEAENNAGGRDLYIQGHPEYDRTDLQREYERDKTISEPYEYFTEHGIPRLNWANDARALHSNWIGGMYRQFSSEGLVDDNA